MYLQEQAFALEGVGRLEQLSSAERRDEVEAASWHLSGSTKNIMGSS